MGICVVQILRPLIFQPFPSGTARVCNIAASEPAPGSDMPKHIIFSPAIIQGRICARASSVTAESTALGPKAQCEITKSHSQLCGPHRR